MGNSELGVGEKRKRESLLKENGALLQQWGEETSLCLMGHLCGVVFGQSLRVQLTISG